ncbi:TetR/AcrR family transcriptional regulator [Leucobacter denitrificans]|uniref:TetR/AcrR family transcriptional regulator n=1 Tax=Leucobacter denitrificans TaxID=683042 RepID=A0A7G9S4A6_9MICO|nr:TetR/AcrR family transcriptional regulator [Leucobacter denitrificans]QNN62681.1 TetR/AcrR family transcriptional regulator [Leucobacter denitrificans]
MDPRARHTRSVLFKAVLALAADRPIGEIPVTEIVTRAGVNRSSFYQHFTDREELLASALESLETEAARPQEPVHLNDSTKPPTELVRFARHFAEHADLYRQALGPHGSARVASRVRARTIAIVQEGIERSPVRRNTELPVEVEAAGTAGAILGVIEFWLSQDPLPSPEVAADWMWGSIA